jgi:DNA-binding transcriptional MerR regulator
MDKLTTVDIAEKMGQSQSTIRHWQQKYGIRKELKKGKALYTPDQVAVFEAVKELIAKGAGDTTIKKRIGSDNPPPMAQQQPTNGAIGEATAQPTEPMTQQSPANPPPMDDDRIRVILRDELAQQSDLAEKYARAAHQIGQHEERERQLVATIDELREQVKLLQAPKPEPEKPRPWWAKLFG